MAGIGPLAVGPVLIGLHVKAADRVVVQICVITVGHGF